MKKFSVHAVGVLLLFSLTTIYLPSDKKTKKQKKNNKTKKNESS